MESLSEPTLHQILYFLPAKDATKTSVLSKTWYSAWHSFPVLDFNQIHHNIGPRKKPKVLAHDFLNYVSNSVPRRCQNMNIQRFNLTVELDERTAQETPRHLERWLDYVGSRHVEHLVLHCDPKYRCHADISLTSALFRAKSLKELDLCGFNFFEPVVNRNIGHSVVHSDPKYRCHADISLTSALFSAKSLKELDLCGFNFFEPVVNRNIGHSVVHSDPKYMCHADISLTSALFRAKSLKELDLCVFNFLVSVVSSIWLLEASANKMRSSAFPPGRDRNGNFSVPFPPLQTGRNRNIGNFSLKKLKLAGVTIDKQTLQSLLSNSCSSLEEVSFKHCDGFGWLSICSSKLRSLDLLLNNVEEITIEAPNLRVLKLDGVCANRVLSSSIEASKYNQNLKELVLSNVDYITGVVVKVIQGFEALEKFKLTNCTLTERIRISIWKGAVPLKYAGHVAHCWNCERSTSSCDYDIKDGCYRLRVK